MLCALTTSGESCGIFFSFIGWIKETCQEHILVIIQSNIKKQKNILFKNILLVVV